MSLFRLYHNRFLREEAPDNGGGGNPNPPAAPGRPSLADPEPDPNTAPANPPADPPPANPEPGKTEPPAQEDYVLAFDETFTGDETLQNLLTETGKAHGLPVKGLSAFIKDMDTRMAAKAAEQQQAQP